MVEWLDGLIAEAKSSWMNPYNTAHSSSRSPDSAVEEEQPEDNDVNDDTELNEVDQLSRIETFFSRTKVEGLRLTITQLSRKKQAHSSKQKVQI